MLAAREVDAFFLESDGSMLLSLGADGTIPDVGSVDDHDIVRFVPTSTGDVTAGTFELYFNGEDFDLTTSGEDIDAIRFRSGRSSGGEHPELVLGGWSVWQG